MINRGEMCLSCRQDTSFGTGKFVNRIPAYTDEEVGYTCVSCENETRLECYKICLNCGGETCEGDSTCIFCGETNFRPITKEDL